MFIRKGGRVMCLEVVRKIDKQYVVEGEIIQYTIQVTQKEEGRVEQAQLVDILAEEVEFVPGSVMIDNLPRREVSIISGIPLENFIPHVTKTINFDAKIIGGNYRITLDASLVSYQYITPTREKRQIKALSNIDQIDIYKVDLEVKRVVSPEVLLLGEELKCEVTFSNESELDIVDIQVKEKFPGQLTIEQGEFKINDRRVNSVDLSKGIGIGGIKKGEKSYLRYTGTIKELDTRGIQFNALSIQYSYLLPDGRIGEKNIECGKRIYREERFEVGITSFKDVNIEYYLNIPDHNVAMSTINQITGTVNILKHYDVQTPIGISIEGQCLTGKSLLVRGDIQLVCEYTGEDKTSIYGITYQIPFTTNVMMAESYVERSKVEVKGSIQDIWYVVIDNRTAFISINALVNSILIKE